MSDLNSPAAPPPSQRLVTPAPVTSGDSSPQGQTPRHSDGQPLPQEQQPTPNPAVTLSASLAGMSAGSVVEAVVLGPDAEGVPVIRAAGGTFLAAAQDVPPAHAELVLKIQSTGHEIRALVMSVDGEPKHPPSEIRLLLTNVGGGTAAVHTQPAPVETYAPPIGGARAPDQPAHVASSAQPLAAGMRLTAQIVPTPLATAALVGGDLTASAPAVSATASPYPIGTPMLVRIISVGGGTAPSAPMAAAAGQANIPPQVLAQEIPVAGVQTGPTTAPAPPAPNATAAPPDQLGRAPAQAPTHQAIQKPATPASGPVAAQEVPRAGEEPSKAGNPLAAQRVASSSTTPAPAGQSTTALSAQPISGTVLEPAQTGQTLIQTAQGTFEIDAALSVKPGVEVTLEAVPSSNASSPSGVGNAAPATPQAALVDFSAGWNSLRDLVQAVQVADPGIAQQFVSQTVPSLNSRAASNILFFLSALRGGDVQGWLGGDMTRAAERAGLRRLIDRLGDDFIQLRTLIDADDDADWRVTPFPFFDGEEIEPVSMFVRGRKRSEQESEDDVRFVVQVELSALGEMQLDGLFRPQNFDLIVRSRGGLDDRVRHDISSLFNDAIEVTGLKGNIVFQNVDTFPVSPFGDLFGVEPQAGNVVA